MKIYLLSKETFGEAINETLDGVAFDEALVEAAVDKPWANV